MTGIEETFQKLCEHMRHAQRLASVQALLEWDQQTQLPPGGAAYRADQIAELAGQVHQLRTASQVGDRLSALADSPLASDRLSDPGATIRQWKRDYDKKSRLPTDLVRRLASACSLGQQAWVEARQANDFARFQPHLDTILQLKREEASATTRGGCLYDALLDDYEPGARTSEVAALFEQLKSQLVPLLDRVAAAADRVTDEPLHRSFPQDRQAQLAREVTAAIGFDYQRGRLDIAPHPFCTELGPSDCRITTRYDEHFFSTAFFGALHEAGHGLYEQGLRQDQYGLPLGTYCSLGLHESQSRLWENLVGRSETFWDRYYSRVRDVFPESLGDVPRDAFVSAVNRICPSLIRVEADEATYDLHIIIRFELEQALIEGDLSTDDLPAAWNEKYRLNLGVTPPTDAQGVLQDVHWSAGLWGYFPTYTLGNVYASQLWEQAGRDLPELASAIAQGQFGSLLDWLRRGVHAEGRRRPAAELVHHLTGSPPDPAARVRHLASKVERFYG